MFHDPSGLAAWFAIPIIIGIGLLIAGCDDSSSSTHIPTNGRFNSADDAAIDFATRFNQASIEERREFGSAIYSFVDNGNTYFSYTDPRKGNLIGPSSNYEAWVKPSNAPRGTIEVAQIHTHSLYVNIFYSTKKNPSIGLQSSDGFSREDRDVAEKRGVDTYVVTPWGNMFKGTNAKNYSDRSDIFLSGFYRDPNLDYRINNPLDLRNDTSLWFK